MKEKRQVDRQAGRTGGEVPDPSPRLPQPLSVLTVNELVYHQTRGKPGSSTVGY